MSSPEFRSTDEVLHAVVREAAARRVVRDRRRRLVASGAAALVVVAVGAGALVVAGRDDGPGRELAAGSVRPGTSTTARPDLTQPEGWAPMADSPLSARSSAITAWTGRELLVWGGEGATSDACEVLPDGGARCGEPVRADGAAYDPSADSWRSMAPSPLPEEPGSSMESYGGVWTGEELLVWGGPGPDAAAYDPDADAWRTIDAGPLGPRVRFSATWTGSELVIHGGLDGRGIPGTSTEGVDDGARYDPATDTWTSVAGSGVALTDPVAVWVDGELLVWPGDLAEEGADRAAAGRAYDPASSTWRSLPPVPVHAVAPPVWTGSAIVVLGTRAGSGGIELAAASYDPATETWTELPALPAPPAGEEQAATLTRPAAVWTGSEVVVVGPSAEWLDQAPVAAAYDPSSSTWRPLASGGPEGRGGMAAAWTGTELVLWGGATSGGYGADPVDDGARYRPGPGR